MKDINNVTNVTKPPESEPMAFGRYGLLEFAFKHLFNGFLSEIIETDGLRTVFQHNIIGVRPTSGIEVVFEATTAVSAYMASSMGIPNP